MLTSRRKIAVSVVHLVYAGVLVALWWASGIRFDGESRARRARWTVDAAFGDPPDVEQRTIVLRIGALAGAVPAFVIGAVGWICAATFGGDPWYRATLQAVGIVGAWMVVAAVRHVLASRDRARWIRAGRPASWTRSRLATPGGRDLIYVAVLALGLAWLLGASFDAQTTASGPRSAFGV